VDPRDNSQDIVLSALQTLIFKNFRFNPPAGVICMTYGYVKLMVYKRVHMGWIPASRRDAGLMGSYKFFRSGISFSAGHKKPEGGNGVSRGSFGKSSVYLLELFYFKYHEILFLNFIASEILLKFPEVLT